MYIVYVYLSIFYEITLQKKDIFFVKLEVLVLITIFEQL